MKQRNRLNEYHLHKIERKISLLETTISNAQVGLKLFCAQGEALMQLRTDLRVAVNLLNGRSAERSRGD